LEKDISMSDTSRTDAIENFIHYEKARPSHDYVRSARLSKEKEGFVLSTFARQLERELNAANIQLAEYKKNA